MRLAKLDRSELERILPLSHSEHTVVADKRQRFCSLCEPPTLGPNARVAGLRSASGRLASRASLALHPHDALVSCSQPSPQLEKHSTPTDVGPYAPAPRVVSPERLDPGWSTVGVVACPRMRLRRRACMSVVGATLGWTLDGMACFMARRPRVSRRRIVKARNGNADLSTSDAATPSLRQSSSSAYCCTQRFRIQYHDPSRDPRPSVALVRLHDAAPLPYRASRRVCPAQLLREFCFPMISSPAKRKLRAPTARDLGLLGRLANARVGLRDRPHPLRLDRA